MCSSIRRIGSLLLILGASFFGAPARGGDAPTPFTGACSGPFPEESAAGWFAAEPRVKVRMYDYAQAPASVLAQAQQVAWRIVRETGVNTEWVNCQASDLDPRESDPGCDEPVRPADVALRLLPDWMAKAAGTRASIYGFAKPPYIAFVFFDRVEDLVESGATEASHVILGHLLAHELGHLLLGRKGHSRKGIMRIPWKQRELKLAEQGRLLFTDGESERMSSQVCARMQDDPLASAPGLSQAEAEGSIGLPSDPVRPFTSKTACGQCR